MLHSVFNKNGIIVALYRNLCKLTRIAHEGRGAAMEGQGQEWNQELSDGGLRYASAIAS